MNNNMAENMYPEVYNHFAPIADSVIKDIEKQYGGDIHIDENMLNQMVEEAIRRSAINDNISAKEDAVPVIYQHNSRYGHGYNGKGKNQNHWRNYDRSSLSDIYRILLLQQLFGRRRPRWR